LWPFQLVKLAIRLASAKAGALNANEHTRASSAHFIM
jgi:hypothetical protein